MILKAAVYGSIGAATLLAAYFAVVSLISGWPFALDQFGQFWYFVISLAVGFGIQIGLYTYLRNAVRQKNSSGSILAVSGTTSTAAMLSCCAHYLANILPIIGAAGIISIIGQYQIQLFWIGLAFNLGGILYITSRIVKFVRA